MIHVIGGGLAGSEAAWQAASRACRVIVHEMRPVRPTAVHKTDRLAELVCSNSFRGDKLDNAVGLLKEEMRRLGSLVMRAADAHRVPAGAALAVDRELFSQAVTDAIASHPLITVVREEVARIPDDASMFPLIIATGPLTSDVAVGRHRGARRRRPPVFLRRDQPDRPGRDDRHGRRSSAPRAGAGASEVRQCAGTAGTERSGCADPRAAWTTAQGDYLNCPLTKDEYDRFYDALSRAESATVHDFDKEKFFEGCLPIEVMAHRGRDTLRFGPMKPVGLVDPRTGRTPYAVVQLRQDNLAGDHFSLVGFQTQLKWGEQARVLQLIPGLEQAEFVRFGMVHRNTYINGPTVLRETWQTQARPDLFFAGQISGVEGYVESAASGLIAGRNAAALVRGEEPRVPPRTTAIGALAYYVSHADPRQLPADQHHLRHHAAAGAPPGRDAPRRTARLPSSDRALQALDEWMRRRASAPARMKDQLRDVPRLPSAESQRLRSHRCRLRQRPVAVPRLCRRQPGQGHGAARRRRPRTRARSGRSWRSCIARGSRGRPSRASCRRCAASRGFSAGKD